MSNVWKKIGRVGTLQRHLLSSKAPTHRNWRKNERYVACWLEQGGIAKLIAEDKETDRPKLVNDFFVISFRLVLSLTYLHAFSSKKYVILDL